MSSEDNRRQIEARKKVMGQSKEAAEAPLGSGMARKAGNLLKERKKRLAKMRKRLERE